jgi:carboxymethylenebutenolidase
MKRQGCPRHLGFFGDTPHRQARRPRLNQHSVNRHAPIMGHWATQDEFFKIDTIDALEEKLSAAKVDFEFHRYLAHHAFANETAVGPARIPATQYDPVWAQQAWDRTLHFFGRTLG